MILKNSVLLSCLCIALLFPSPLQAEELSFGAKAPLFGVALDGYPITRERLESVEKDIGISPRIVVFFLQWPSVDRQDDAPFPRESLEAIWSEGAIPCLTWEPMYYRAGLEFMVPYQDILNGAYDPYLLEFARQTALLKKPYIIRFAHEMDTARYHWGTKASDYGPESPRIYQEMFRYVVTLFQKTGAHKVLWAFCPNSESVPNASYDPSASWNRMEAYYPGHTYVDVLGMDGYNWGTTQTKATSGWDSEWKAFADIFRPVWEKLRHLAPNKPIIVFETGSVDQGGDKKRWIKNAFDTAREWKLKGLVWFQVSKEYDWRINSRMDVP
ncbi:MAG: endoglucanase [Deltaproteobacteria bacterium]|nr:endoglucanase [Deltaproteobacteria bacterium]